MSRPFLLHSALAREALPPACAGNDGLRGRFGVPSSVSAVQFPTWTAGKLGAVAMIVRENQNGLLIAGRSMDERAVDAELKKRDPRLFLDKEVDLRGRLVYSAAVSEPDGPPSWRMYWHDGYGTPLPLSSGILDRLDSLRREHTHETPGEANRRRADMLDRDAEYDYEEIERTIVPRLGRERTSTRRVHTPERMRRNEAERRRRLGGQ